MRSLHHIFWLGIKELRALLTDPTMVIMLVMVFTVMVYSEATSLPENVNNASIAIADEDNSILSRKISNAFYPPYFQTPRFIDAGDVAVGMDNAEYLFAMVIPSGFEADLRNGDRPEIQLHIDATAVMQAGLGDGYIQSIIQGEVAHYLANGNADQQTPINLVVRRAFNPNGDQSWFAAISSVLNFVALISIMLTGAALLREREHGTIGHLLVMPLTAFEIAAAKIWSNGLVILIAFFLSFKLVIEQWIGAPVHGSYGLLLAGTAIFLFATAAIGILLGTIAQTMAQFALLILMTYLPMMMLSGGMSPIESQPEVVQYLTWFLPTRHYLTFAQAVVFRAADISIVWPELLAMAGMGLVFLVFSLRVFRTALARSG